MQPKWRALDNGAFLQKAPDTIKEWEGLVQGGPNGFFIIVVAFSWWAKKGGVDDLEIREALDDIIWVLRSIADKSALPDQLIGEKHPQEDEPVMSIRKKYVFSFLFILKLIEQLLQEENEKNVREEEKSSYNSRVLVYIIPSNFAGK